MLEGSPPDPASDASAESGSPQAPAQPTSSEEPTDAEVDEATSTERTPDQVEAIWKNRVAGKDRAHAAETATLRSQIDALNTRLATREAEDQTSMSEAEREKARADAAEAALTEERKGRTLDVRTVKYAAAAEALEPDVLAIMDEPKLAALNARLKGEDEAAAAAAVPPAPPIDPNAAPRRTTTPQAPREKSVEELESDLEKFSPDFTAGWQG